MRTEEHQIKLHQALLSDGVLRDLYRRRYKICSIWASGYVLDENGNLTHISDENNPVLVKIKEAIKFREDQIKSFYER